MEKVHGQDYQLNMTFVSTTTPARQFTRNIPPIFHWFDKSGKVGPLLIVDNIPLHLPPDTPAGAYRIKIGMASGDDRGAVQNSLELPAVTLYSTKKEVLISSLKNSEVNWALLVKVLLML
jgi:hypothetical protein